MTIDGAHIMLGINQKVSLDDIAKKYLLFKKTNHDVSYVEWLEQEVIIQDKCIKLGVSEEDLFSLTGLSRSDIVSQSLKKSFIR